MAKVHIIFILVSSLMLIADARILFQKREKKEKYSFYIHEVIRGPNATLYEVARANITSTSPTTSFGQVSVADDLITAEADANSEKLGRAQGLVVYSGLEEEAASLNFNIIFTGGKYNGSSVSVLGWRLLSAVDQQLSIVGGTGVFRMARGYTISRTYSYDPIMNHLVFKYDMYAVFEE